jgi:hypothetical protein
MSGQAAAARRALPALQWSVVAWRLQPCCIKQAEAKLLARQPQRAAPCTSKLCLDAYLLHPNCITQPEGKTASQSATALSALLAGTLMQRPLAALPAGNQPVYATQ